MTSKRSTALGATVGLLAVAVLAISVVTLIKVYSTEPPQTQAGSDTGDSSGNGKTDGSNSNNTQGNPEGVLNIPAPPTVNQQSSVQFQAYSGYAQQLHSSVNLGVNPCVDFYTYACGQYNQSLGFYEVNLRNFRQIAQQLTNKAYINAFDLPKPVKQSSIFYSKCLDALQNWQSRAVDGDLVVNKLANFGQILGVPFPALTKNGADSTVQLYGFPNSSVLGASLGYLSYTEGLNTLVSFSIETNWKKPHSDQPYALFIDQASLVFPDNYYTKIWDQVRDDYSNETFAIIKAYADYTGANVDEDKLKADVQKILNLEYVIASQKNTPGNVRRNLERLYNPFTVSNATQTFPNIDFFQLIREAVHRTPSRQYSFVIKEVDALNRILNHITSKKVEPATVYNYLYYRLLRQNIAYLPSSENKFGPNAFLRVQKSGSIFNELGHIGSTKYNKKRPWVLGQGWKFPDKPDDWQSIYCVAENAISMAHANSRTFLDAVFPDVQGRAMMKDNVAKLVASILDAFQGMVAQLDWMTTDTKWQAYQKIQNLVKNIAYPDLVTDNDALNKFYDQGDISLIFDDDDSFVAIQDALRNFQRDLAIKSLVKAKDTDRLKFGDPGYNSAALVDAWFMEELNSLTIPMGILQKPFYNSEYPSAVNYGSLGSIIGHEIIHAFDDIGVQWDATGVLKTWMDDTSQKGFNKMAQCVIDGYGKFEPLAGMKIDGVQTLGENIADNGGIQAAYRAFQAYRALYGPDPQLPDSLYRVFNHEQLFFMSYAQSWCSKPMSDNYVRERLLVDTHSPVQYRVFGTMQNFPAFKSAFNCPAKSPYAPENPCRVWVSDSVAVTGVPPTKPTLPPANIPLAVPSTSKKYSQASAFFEYSVDPTKDPCNNFYGYACGNHNDFMSFDYADSYTLEAMVYGLRRPIDNTAARPVKQVKQLYQQCKVAMNNWSDLIKDGARAKDAVSSFLDISEFPFPILSKKTRTYDWPDYESLGIALGYMSGVLDVDTLVTPFVDTDWVEAQSNKIPFKLYLDQATLGLPRVFYIGQTWDLFKDWYTEYVTHLFQRFAAVMPTKLNATALKEDVDAIVQFEYTIANQLTTDDNTRRNFKRSYNPVRLKNQTVVNSFEFISLPYFVYMFGYKYATMEQLYKLFEKEPLILMEPELFRQYNSAFSDDSDVVSARTLYNYLLYRIIKKNSVYLPPLPKSLVNGKNTKHEIFEIMETHFYDEGELKKNMTELELRARQLMYSYEYEKPLIGRPSYIKKKYPKIGKLKRLKKSREEEDDYTLVDLICAYRTMNLMPFANARVYIDQMYPDENNRDYLRGKAAELITNVVNSFKSMVDQLSWMSTKAKDGSYKKVQNLVKNVAYPDFITNDTQLTNYYHNLDFTGPSSYLTMLDDVKDYRYLSMWELIDATGNADRSDFLGPPGSTNAWYQPQLNSITFPASILQQPFYDPEWPASVNYGGLGVVAGHELTHGFDDEGIQWNEVGELREWLDPLSQKGFRKMADCVVKEYNKFCPLNGDIYQPSCVNGDNTQGENIADNGGIRAAFLAYRNFLNLNGPDPQLPGPLAKQFNHDQLFFLSFAQVWCENKPPEDEMFFQLLLDPHSPSEYRVWGTIQNFPAFRSAFNCPAGKAYTPEKHCNVWIDEIKAVTGVPPTVATLPPANIPQAVPSTSKKYTQASSYFEYSIDATKDPCNDFYAYACGNHEDDFMSFDIADSLSVQAMVYGLRKPINDADTRPVMQVKQLYRQCKVALNNWDELIKNGARAKKFINDFSRTTKFPFPLFAKKSRDYSWPSADDLGMALGYMSGVLGVDTLVTPFVDTDWVEAQSNKIPYKLYLDQATLALPRVIYTGQTWDLFQDWYANYVTELFQRFALVINTKLNATALQEDVDAIVQFEYTVANQLTTDDNTRRNFKRSYNPIRLKNQTVVDSFKFINLPYFVAMFGYKYATMQQMYKLFEKENIIVKEPGQFSQYNQAFVADNVVVSPRTLFNYLFYRLLKSNSIYLPPLPEDDDLPDDSSDDTQKTKHEIFKIMETRFYDKDELKKNISELELRARQIMYGYEYQRPLVGQPKHIKKKYPKIRILKRLMKDDEDYYDMLDVECSYSTMGLLPYANARVYIDQMYPDPNTRNYIRNKAAELITNVVNSFKSMVDQLSWMSTKAKEGSYKKVQNLVKNVAYPDFITDDAQLTAFYRKLNFTKPKNFFVMLDDINDFDYRTLWDMIDATGNADRSVFNGPPATTNAWYQPQLNSITFPASILQQPFYDPEWPISINYGGLGVIAGHELTHGFDDEGIQWNEVGELREWLDPLSQKGFRKMADCVVKEYNKFCPLNGDYYQPSCVNGDNTQGENIADNGGIRAAFLAYRNFINLNGQDPQLPGALAKQFNHDQLFFLSFAQVWCEPKPSEDDTFFQLLLDPHSPSEYRVWGTIQNFPAFRSAFNCPAGKAYTPEKHCNVWIDEIKAVTGVPPTMPTPPSLNIPAVRHSKSKKYAQAAAYFSSSVDTSQDPCNNFYEYTCANFDSPMYFYSMQMMSIMKNNLALLNAVESQNDADDDTPISLLQTTQFYNQCVTDLPSWNKLTPGIIVQSMRYFNMWFGPSFPLISTNPKAVYHWPSPTDLAFGLGYMRGFLAEDVLLSVFVDTTWDNPQSDKTPYSLYFDQPSLIFPRSFYLGAAWDKIQQFYIMDVFSILKAYVKLIGSHVEDEEILKAASEIAQFEKTVARELTMDDDLRRNYSRSYNPISMMELNDKTKWIDMEMFEIIMLQRAPWDVFVRLFFHDDAKVILMEPTIMRKWERAFKEHNRYGFTPKQLINYLYLRVLVANKVFMSKGITSLFKNVHSVVPIKAQTRPDVGRPRWERAFSIEESFGITAEQEDDKATSDVMTEFRCSMHTMFSLPYTTTRHYIDLWYPSKKSRTALRQNVGGVVSGVLGSFRSMVDQLNWMSDFSKKGANDKVENLARNLAYPDFITNNTALDAYYADLELSGNFVQNRAQLRTFQIKKQWSYLAAKGGIQREEFNGPPGAVNAWYQPELNSITLPLAILEQPFYDSEWPASVNYGAIGMVTGHELTHGFDDQGVQFDGTGKLRNWFDASTMSKFKEMAQCVVDEYTGMCPLDPNKYSPNCVNGFQTQGENIADNGGVRAAFNAYRNAMNLRGEDMALPHNLVGQFTHDQLFFLSFTQIWCEPDFNPESTYLQLLIDPHSPSRNRIWGTLQNFPAFQNAFNCPKGSAYAPVKHCDVWASEPKLVTGLPLVSVTPPSLNLPERTRQWSKKYLEASQFFEESVDTSFSPCDNFYEYACNNYEKPISFEIIDFKNLIQLAESYKVDDGQQIEPLEKAKLMFRKCEELVKTWDKETAKDNVPNAKYYQYQKATNLPHPLFNGNQPAQWLNATELGRALGVLSGQMYVDSLLTSFIMTNWKDPEGETPYAMFLDQSTLSLPAMYYSGFWWDMYHEYLGVDIQYVMMMMADNLGASYDFNDLDNAVQDILDIEWTIANNFLTDDDTRRQFERNYNWMSVKQANAKFPFLDFQTFLTETVFQASPEVKQVVNRDDFHFVLMEPDQLAGVGNMFQEGNAYGITPSALLDYVYWRLIFANAYLIPEPDTLRSRPSKLFDIKVHRPPLGPPVQLDLLPLKKEIEKQNAITFLDFECAEETFSLMEYAASRVYIDYALPTTKRSFVRNSAQKVLNSILLGFRSMIEQNSWMTPQSKQAAFDKIENIVTNVAYPDFIMNNTALTLYYKDLDITEQDDFLVILDRVMQFFYKQQFDYLVTKKLIELNFQDPPFWLVNAWYQPWINSITLPAAILQQPFFDPEWPAAINFGSLGVVVGHELSHGFDDQGVQWDGVGALNRWLDPTSQISFDKMAQCIINEYNNFCPLDPERFPLSCLNGFNTQGENIADNGGIHAAFRAYRNTLEVLGPDYALPNDLVGQFTNDQLFFLSFAQPWCEPKPDDMDTYYQILFDVHSPSRYRILGTLRNFPAFREAFNCPVNSVYAPRKHCEVWVTDTTDQKQPPLPPNSINVPTPHTVHADDDEFSPYRTAFNYFKASVNLSYNPCDNFYEYSCSNYNKQLSFRVYRRDNNNKIGVALEKMENPSSTAVQKLKTFHDLCKVTLGDLQASVRDGVIISNKVQKFADETGLKFTVFEKSAAQNALPNAATFAKAMSYLSIIEGIDTFITPFVDIELVSDRTPTANKLYIDQNTLTYPKSYYQQGAWDVIEPTYFKNVLELLQRYAVATKKSVDRKALSATVQKLLDLEVKLAREPYSTSDTTRRDYSRWNNPKTLSAANTDFSFVDWPAYLQGIDNYTDINQIATGNLADYNAYFTEQNAISQLSQDISDASKFDPDVVVNYLFFRILAQNAKFIPETNSSTAFAPVAANHGFDLGQSKHLRRDRGRPDPFAKDDDMGEAEEDTRVKCVTQTIVLMTFANARVFTDLFLPSQEDRNNIRSATNKLVQNIRHSYRGMMDELDWLDDSSRNHAYEKINGLQINLAYPDFILDDAQLDQTYQKLSIDINQDTYFDAYNKLIVYNNYIQYHQLVDSVDRAFFVGPPSTVNAWYAPEFNSITFPLGILRDPWFNPDWPASINYGGLGVVAGHEVSHAFDDGGVQWNAVGGLENWMTEQSKKSFQQMAKCVVDEYSSFKVLDPNKYQPYTLNGNNTQGENIADNAGIHASFRAYRNYIAINGPDPQLPDRIFGQISHDQLFFLSFAQVWCEAPPSPDAIYAQILTDPHSPSYHRVFGTVQNYPAFRSAFNCPINSVYAPKDHCRVWMPQN